MNISFGAVLCVLRRTQSMVVCECFSHWRNISWDKVLVQTYSCVLNGYVHLKTRIVKSIFDRKTKKKGKNAFQFRRWQFQWQKSLNVWASIALQSMNRVHRKWRWMSLESSEEVKTIIIISISGAHNPKKWEREREDTDSERGVSVFVFAEVKWTCANRIIEN